MTDPYRKASEGVVVIEPRPRALLAVTGRSPAKMFDGMLTARIPPAMQPLEGATSSAFHGRMAYSAMLTPKGRIVTDLRVGRLGPGEKDPLLLDVPAAGIEGAMAHFSTYLPPLFARVEPVADSVTSIALVGPDAPATLSTLLEARAGGISPDARTPADEGDALVIGDAAAPELLIVRSGDVEPVAFELIGPADAIRSWVDELSEAGVEVAGSELWTVLRLERGRPEFGADMDGGTLLPEAGIQDRAIGDSKGCYTGQEVVVRIRDRGRVNRHLRGILIGAGELPAPGTPLLDPESERKVGETRSAAASPRFGQGIALGFVRREIEPPARVRLGALEGPEVEVRTLTPVGWGVGAEEPTGS